MKRTTVFAEEEVMDALRAIARRQGTTLAAVTRKALAAYAGLMGGRRRPLSIIGMGASGRRDVAERAEELLKEGFGR